MIELLPTISTVVSIATKVGEISDKLKRADLMDLVADLRMELAKLKIGIAELQEENADLKSKLKSIDNADGDVCPRCKKLTYRLEKSQKHPTFGEVGGMLRTFQCASCDFVEETLIMPEM